MLNAIVVVELVEELLEACTLKVTDSHRERADTLHFTVRAEHYNADAYVSHCGLTGRLTTLSRQALTDFHILGEVAVVLALRQQHVLIRTALCGLSHINVLRFNRSSYQGVQCVQCIHSHIITSSFSLNDIYVQMQGLAGGGYNGCQKHQDYAECDRPPERKQNPQPRPGDNAS